MRISFSTDPGCRERHLQRKHNNPLFSEADRAITQSQVEEARQQDEAEQARFRQEFHALLQEAVKLDANVENDAILQLKERIDKLYLLCMGFGGDFTKEKQGLLKLHDALMTALRRATASDAVALAEIEQEQVAHKIHLQLLEYPIVAHLLRADSPVGEHELLATLLSEADESLHAAMTLFDGPQAEILSRRGSELLTGLKQQGIDVPAAWARLQVIEDHARTVTGYQTLQ